MLEDEVDECVCKSVHVCVSVCSVTSAAGGVIRGVYNQASNMTNLGVSFLYDGKVCV